VPTVARKADLESAYARYAGLCRQAADAEAGGDPIASLTLAEACLPLTGPPRHLRLQPLDRPHEPSLQGVE
jgi:hypothetical protein